MALQARLSSLTGLIPYGLECGPRTESVFAGRNALLDVNCEKDNSLGAELAFNLDIDLGRGRGLGLRKAEGDRMAVHKGATNRKSIEWGRKWGRENLFQNNIYIIQNIIMDSWRTGWDSNPRYACTHAGFQDRCIRPLCHLSISRSPTSLVTLKAQNIL